MDTGSQSSQDNEHWLEDFSDSRSYMHLGLQAGFSVAFYVGLGVVVDKWLDTMPWFTLVGSLVGIVAMFYLFHRLTKKMNAASEARLKAAKEAEEAEDFTS